MRHTFDEELQISEFIKDPASLKLLILAGTNIRPNELITVNKCVSLIKLDLSSNQLTEIPLRFANFAHLKIVYLHDNQIATVSITKTNLEYISLFDNPIKDYRSSLIESN
jgi:Leucine-rich repeat (LRR) protein